MRPSGLATCSLLPHDAVSVQSETGTRRSPSASVVLPLVRRHPSIGGGEENEVCYLGKIAPDPVRTVQPFPVMGSLDRPERCMVSGEWPRPANRIFLLPASRFLLPVRLLRSRVGLLLQPTVQCKPRSGSGSSARRRGRGGAGRSRREVPASQRRNEIAKARYRWGGEGRWGRGGVLWTGVGWTLPFLSGSRSEAAGVRTVASDTRV